MQTAGSSIICHSQSFVMWAWVGIGDGAHILVIYSGTFTSPKPGYPTTTSCRGWPTLDRTANSLMNYSNPDWASSPRIESDRNRGAGRSRISGLSRSSTSKNRSWMLLLATKTSFSKLKQEKSSKMYSSHQSLSLWI